LVFICGGQQALDWIGAVLIAAVAAFGAATQDVVHVSADPIVPVIGYGVIDVWVTAYIIPFVELRDDHSSFAGSV
jgi:hypothetical protein